MDGDPDGWTPQSSARTVTATNVHGFSSRELCSRVLRKIGAFPITESAADGELVQRQLYWLDLALAELPGTARGSGW